MPTSPALPPGAMLRFIVLVLAVWRVSAFLVYDKQGQAIRDKAKTYATDTATGEPITHWGRILTCLWCTSLYVGGVLALVLATPLWVVLVPFAASGAAILLNHITRIDRVMGRD